MERLIEAASCFSGVIPGRLERVCRLKGALRRLRASHWGCRRCGLLFGGYHDTKETVVRGVCEYCFVELFPYGVLGVAKRCAQPMPHGVPPRDKRVGQLPLADFAKLSEATGVRG